MTTLKKTKEEKKAEKQASAKAHKQSAEPTEATETDGEGAATEALPPEVVATLPPVDDRYLRLQADFDNYRKRVLREKEDIYRRANADLLEDILPVLDHLELAIGSVGEAHKQDPVVEGFRLVGEQLMSVLTRYGLLPIPAEGQEFDPNVHEAILHMPVPEVPENFIVSQARGGYKLGERLLRASQVIVSSGPAAGGDPSASSG